MANLHFSLAGEGRGHAARARTLIEALRPRHQIVVWTFGDAFAFLEPYARATDGVEIREIPGLSFRYDRNGRLAYGRSVWHGARSLPQLMQTVRTMSSALRRECADLVLTDFEPTLPRAARRVGVPVLGVDHQSVFADGDFSALPRALRWHAQALGWVVRRWTPQADLQVSSSFYRPPVRTGCEATEFVGVLLREAVRKARPSRGSHLVAYLRSGTSQNTLEVLRRSRRQVLLYGLPASHAGGSLVHRPISEAGFIEDLAACHALITTAGNQLLGEAMHLGKPILALPEPGNREQEINGWFLQDSGAGRSLPCHEFSERVLEEFLAQESSYRRVAQTLSVDGTPLTLACIEQAIEASRGVPREPKIRTRVQTA